ncbi:MBL fold metallo-hydrolase [Methylocystis sp.]|uniref:MBL fold metallo-hydrolase n=1 Tax=Methylocystis sp. TaxID=1911079 RepID=UPI003DA5C3C9
MSDDGLLCLRPDVVLEPLIDGWFAWSHLIPPNTAAMNIAARHIRLMESFIAMPQAHAAASKNPALRGGQFVELLPERVEEVRTLLAQTRRKRSGAIALHDAIRACIQMLRDDAKGYSLGLLYEKTPKLLQGYVEFVYNISGQPDVHFFEPLLYRSEFHDSSTQSILIQRLSGKKRTFIMSTPRLPENSTIQWDIAFESQAIDALSQLRSTPARWSIIKRTLDKFSLPVDKMRNFFCDWEGGRRLRVRPGPRWSYYGHACLLLESAGGASILIDPIVAYDAHPQLEHFGFADLPDRIDTVLITHNHSDHVNLETLLALRHKIGSIVVPAGGGRLQDPSLKLTLEALGFQNVHAVEPFDSRVCGDATISALPFLGEHADLDVRTKCAYRISYNGWSAMVVADSANLDPILYDHIRQAVGPVDTLFIGMECTGAPMSWVYGPLLCGAIERDKDNSRRLAGSDEKQAQGIVKSLGCREVYVYALGLEPWVEFITSVSEHSSAPATQASDRFVAACREQGIEARRLYGIDASDR